MKKYLFFLAVFMVILSLVSCSFEPIVTTYGNSVHEAVKEHYEAYEILGLVYGRTLAIDCVTVGRIEGEADGIAAVKLMVSRSLIGCGCSSKRPFSQTGIKDMVGRDKLTCDVRQSSVTIRSGRRIDAPRNTLVQVRNGREPESRKFRIGGRGHRLPVAGKPFSLRPSLRIT